MSNCGSIFISYRRSDSIGDTGRIYDYLERHFGRDRVFKDVDSIPLGVNFRDYLDQEVGRCQVLIAVIGPTWLTVTGDDDQRRLDSPTDFVRIEIESALIRKIPVIPLLVNDSTMPKAAELPEGLKALADWQNIVIRHDPDFRRDVNKLIQGIESLMGQTQRHQARQVTSTSTSQSSRAVLHNRPKTRKAIPWLRLSVIFSLYGLQGYAICFWITSEYWPVGVAAATTTATAWAAAVAMSLDMAVGRAVAIAAAAAVGWVVTGVVTDTAIAGFTWGTVVSLVMSWAIFWATAGIAYWAGRRLKVHFRSIQVFWILLSAATAGLVGGGTLLALTR